MAESSNPGTVENVGQSNADSSNTVVENQNVEQPAPQPGGWGIFKTLLVRMVIIYMISSFFRRSPAATDQDGKAIKSATAANIYSKDQLFDIYVYISENERFNDFTIDPHWVEEDLSYGDWTSGLNGDGTYEKSSMIKLSDQVMNNGTIFMHVFLVKGGTSPDPQADGYDKLYAIHRFKQLNKYKKKVYHTTVNLLTGIHALKTI